MTKVFEQEFCHIHTLQDKSRIENLHTDKWKVGNTLLFGNESGEFNLLFDRVSNPYLNIKRETNLIRQLTKERLNSTSEFEIKNIESKFSKESFLFKYFQLTSELVLEEIRLSIFPDKPSRINGIWLCEKKDLELWKSKIPMTLFPQKIFLVKFTGIYHKADCRWITETAFNLENIYRQSIAYWSGNIFLEDSQPDFEYICNGEIRIIKEL